jgi:hypothetical protein
MVDAILGLSKASTTPISGSYFDDSAAEPMRIIAPISGGLHKRECR